MVEVRVRDGESGARTLRLVRRTRGSASEEVGRLLEESVLAGEESSRAAQRGLVAQLGSVACAEDIALQLDTQAERVEVSACESYPTLACETTTYSFDAFVRGLPAASFESQVHEDTGVSSRRRRVKHVLLWAWVDEPILQVALPVA